MNAEHLHLAINHIPMIALAALLVPLGYALLFKQKGLLVLLLAMACVLAASTFLLMQSGEAAEHRMEDGLLRGPAFTDEIHDLVHEHEERAEIAAIASYATAALAAVALVLVLVRPAWGRWAGWATLGGMLITALLAMWTSQAGGWIRHPELRPEVGATTAQAMRLGEALGGASAC